MRKTILILTFVLLLSAVGFGQSGTEVEKSYDKFKNLTSLSMQVGMFPTRDFNVGSWMLQANYTGEKCPANPKIVLMLLSVSDNWKFLRKDLTLRTLLDEKRVALGKMTRAYSDTTGRGNVSEVLTLTVNLKTIETLGNASTLEMQVVSDEFAFKKEQIAKFKVFADKLKSEMPKTNVKPTTKK